jgi:phosphoesterase RecJ-like protein
MNSVDTSEIRHLYDRIGSLLESYDKWILVVHHRPDGDTLGCASAFASLGRDLGKNVIWYGKDPVPDNYQFLANVSRYKEVSGSDPVDNALIVVLDTSNLERSIPQIEQRCNNNYEVINIDHHGDNSLYGTVNLVDDSASSTGEIIWKFFKYQGYRISQNMAEALYVAIMTDTGNFSYGNTTSDVLTAAGEIAVHGARPCYLYDRVYNNQSLKALQLWGRAFGHAEYLLPGVILAWLDKKDFKETGAFAKDTENLVSRILEIKDAVFSILIVEEEKTTRCSFRSCDNSINAQEIASIFGGGGHKQASGCVMDLPLPDALHKIRKKVKEYVERHSSR